MYPLKIRCSGPSLLSVLRQFWNKKKHLQVHVNVLNYWITVSLIRIPLRRSWRWVLEELPLCSKVCFKLFFPIIQEFEFVIVFKLRNRTLPSTLLVTINIIIVNRRTWYWFIFFDFFCNSMKWFKRNIILRTNNESIFLWTLKDNINYQLSRNKSKDKVSQEELWQNEDNVVEKWKEA